MTRNLRVIWAASVVFGLSVGCYDLVLPFYLKQRGLDYRNMGVVFAFSSAVMFFVRVYFGRLSDLFGRKRFYSLALFASGTANLLTPFAGATMLLALLRSLREASSVTRESMQALLLYRDSPKRYAETVGRTLGSEYLFQGLGTLGGGALIALMAGRQHPMEWALKICALLLFAVFVLFVTAYREHKDGDQPAPEAMSWLRLFSFDMPRELRIIAGASLLASLGLSMSHSFTMPLFFSEKFGASEQVVAVILALHRIVLGVPMLFAGLVRGFRPRNAYAFLSAVQGATMAAGAVIPSLVPATFVWLLHDFVGAGLWLPIQYTLIQRYSGNAKRGLHVSKTMAYSALGWVAGPLLAGYLARWGITTPFLASGIVVALSAAPLMLLPAD